MACVIMAAKHGSDRTRGGWRSKKLKVCTSDFYDYQDGLQAQNEKRRTSQDWNGQTNEMKQIRYRKPGDKNSEG